MVQVTGIRMLGRQVKVMTSRDILYIDAQIHNADWSKQSWDLPPYKSKEFMEQLEMTGMTLEHFKTLPVYKNAIKNGLIQED